VPSALAAALATPIRELAAMVGPGWTGDPLTDPALALGRARDALNDIAQDAARAWQRTDWTGAGADGAHRFVSSTVAAIDRLTEHADRLSTTAGEASVAVGRAHQRLEAIADEFETRAAALEARLDSPAAIEELLGAAREALDEATAVVEQLERDLDAHAASLRRPPSAAATPSTSPAGFAPAGLPSAGAGFASTGASGAPSAGRFGGLLGDLADLAQAPADTPDAAVFGDGVAIRLPDGSTAMAPNAVAASAVRHALTQLGVPYDWGGTTPGVGLDCSGLTQWAYHEAGLELPRLAQEQDVGAPVDPGALRPGDLAVWDGHVAMIVGNGTMIEAGDPVKLSPVRTTNAGQGFQGFWRPTA
jgi:cell wall-associated NlpC family hydrolase